MDILLDPDWSAEDRAAILEALVEIARAEAASQPQQSSAEKDGDG